MKVSDQEPQTAAAEPKKARGVRCGGRKSLGDQYGLESKQAVAVTISVPAELLRVARVCAKQTSRDRPGTSAYLGALFLKLLGSAQAAREVRSDLRAANAPKEDIEAAEKFLNQLAVHLFKAKTKIRNREARARREELALQEHRRKYPWLYESWPKMPPH